MAVDTEKLADEAAFLVALAEHGIPADVQELLVRGDGRGTVLPGALRKALAALRRVAEPVGLAELTLHCITSADPGVRSEQTLAHDMAMMARQAVERLNEGRSEPVGEDRVERVAPEITPEMIEAGCDAILHNHIDMYDLTPPDQMEATLAAVFRAMFNASRIEDTRDASN